MALKPRMRLTDSALGRFRNQAGLMQREAADALGCWASDVSDWEAGRREPNADTYAHMATLYGVGVQQLMDAWKRDAKRYARRLLAHVA